MPEVRMTELASEIAAADAHLKAVCAREQCQHTRGWHLGMNIPSNLASAYVLSMKGGPCNHPGCKCQGYVEPAPLSSEVPRR